MDSGAAAPASAGVDVLAAVSALCAAVDEAASEQEVLERALPILRSVLGDRVALDLRPTASVVGPSSVDGVVAPVLGGGLELGVLRASGCALEVGSARAFASTAGWLVGAGLARHHDRGARAQQHVPRALAHRLRSALATIGVAASALRSRGDALGPELRDRLLADIEVNVSALRRGLDELTAGDPGHRPGG